MLATFDVSLVILSIFVAVVAAYTALDLAERVTAAQGITRKLWLTGGATAMGMGIWSMHFVGMLAYKLPIAIGYNLITVLMSMGAAIVASFAALYIVSRQSLGWISLLAGGIFMGLAITSMHYIGMMAMRMQAIIEYDIRLVIVSVAIAITTSLIALWLAFRAAHTCQSILQKMGSAGIMGSAIAGMHYTAMAAATMQPSSQTIEVSGNILGTSTLAIGVSLASLFPLSLILLASLFDRRKIYKELQKQQQFINAILENISDGIVACDSNGSLTLFNQANKQFYNAPVKPLPPSEWLEHYDLYCADGKTPMSQEDIPLYKAFKGETVRNQEMVIVSQEGIARTLLASGRAIFDSDGNKLGAVVSMHDISERKQNEEALKKLNEELELLVQQRTTELVKANQDLQAEIAQRKRKDEALIAANRTLKQSELRFRSLVTNIPGVIYRRLHDDNWTTDFLSDAIENVSGYPASDFTSNRVRAYSSIIHPQDQANVNQGVNKAIEQKQPFIVEYRILHADGSIRWIYEKGKGHFENDRLLWIDGAIFDITQHKEAQETLKETEYRLRLLIEGVKDYGIFMLDPRGNITTWNTGAERITGYTVEDIIGQHFSIFYPPEDVEIGKTEYELEIANAQGKYEEEGWRVRKDGTYFWASVVISALRNEAGDLRGFAKVTRDVTARKHDEQRLRKWADIFQHAGQGLIVTTPGTNVLEMMNPAFAKMHGYTVEELMGLPIATILAPESLQKTFEQIRVSQRKERYGFETQHIRRDGTIFPVFIDITNVKDNQGQITYSIVNVQDITQRKKAENEIIKALEKERELAELRARFISMTSHEFRTPLATILSSSELLEHYSHKLKDSNKKELFRQIEVAIQRMTQLLEDVLAINKAEAGKIQFKPEALNLEKLCREILTEIQQIAGNSYDIIFTVSGECTQAIMDGKLLRHIFTNLLSNAVKYSPQGGRVEFSLTCQNKEVVFQVKDSGIGIPLEDQKNLFSSFHRASNVGDIPGTGLGLSIVKRFVDLHQGRITVESEIGVSTTFTVTIPLIAGEPQNE